MIRSAAIPVCLVACLVAVTPGRAAPPEVPRTQNEMRVAALAKRVCVALMNHHGDNNANALREFIDPGYLKKHGLTDGDLSVAMPAVGGIFDIQVADDEQTVLCIVRTGPVAKDPVKEVLVFRVSDTEGKGGVRYLLPPKAPDSKTGVFTPWILRTKL